MTAKRQTEKNEIERLIDKRIHQSDIASRQMQLGSNANFAGITNDSSTNGMGVGGPTIVALIKLTARTSGLFEWKASAVQAAAAATEVVTWTVTTQTGTGAFSATGGTSSHGYSGSQVASKATDTPANVICLTSNGAAGTGIAITGGGGGSLTQFSVAKTIGTAAVGDAFATGGIAQNSVLSIISGPQSTIPFGIGKNVIFALAVTNSATNRVVSGINFEVWELTSP